MTAIGMRFFDPLYGPILLDDLERKLVLTPEFQRLRNVRMCNINSMLISGASEISRFEHSVGVLHLAKIWAKKNEIAGDESIVLRSAALLHDMQTGPFGHSLQYVVEDNGIGNAFVHDDILHGYQEQFHQRLLATAGYKGSVFESPRILSRLWKRVAEAIKGEGRLGALISSSLDLDNLDNVVRLAYHVGVATTDDIREIPFFVEKLNVENGALGVVASGVSFIERWQSIRKRLYELLLLDWAEFSAKAMLTLAIEKSFNSGLLDQQSWLLTDDALFDLLEQKGVGEFQDVGELVRRLRIGNLYHPVFLASTPEISLYKTIGGTGEKREIEKSLTLSLREEGRMTGKLIVHLILDHKKTERSVSVNIDHSKTATVIGQDSKKLLVGVFSSGVLPQLTKDMIFQRFKELARNFKDSEFNLIQDPVLNDGRQEQLEEQQLNLGLG